MMGMSEWEVSRAYADVHKIGLAVVLHELFIMRTLQ